MAYRASNYERHRLIISAVKSFGAALKQVRGKIRARDVAARALGTDSSDIERRDFANYLSKIEHDKVPGVGIDRVRLIAKGLGFNILSAFFLQIEQAQRSDIRGQKETENVGLLTAEAQLHNATSSGTQGVVNAISATLHQVDVAALPDQTRLAVARALIEAGTRLTMPPGTAAPGSHRSSSSSDDRKSKRRNRRA